MMLALCLVPVLVAVALPLVALPTPAIATLGALAALLCGVGALGRMRPLVTAGAAVVLMQYALVLVLAGSPPDLVRAAVLGVALALVLDMADVRRRFHACTLSAPARRGLVRHWVVSAGLGALAAFTLAAAATLVRLDGPPALYPILAAGGALGAAAGAVGALRRRNPSGA